MKKVALISGLLFMVVYFWVNTFSKEESSFDVVYPSVSVNSFTDYENVATPVTGNTVSPPADNNQVKYNYLIVASFTDIDQAGRMAEEYAGKLQADMFVLPATTNGYYRVSYGRYSTTAEALSALETLKGNNFPDAWLLASK
ncbi:MAG TPA: SPOR domain-containing protein [Bacteroidales bacterium]|jgi:hypothetical protein|nr:SPOR domain-containing protein [Bacteroidales bacterium]